MEIMVIQANCRESITNGNFGHRTEYMKIMMVIIFPLDMTGVVIAEG